MTKQEREELIEKMAKSICALYKLNQNDWREWIKECRAALAVAEPVIREQCAKIVDELAKEYRLYPCHFPYAEDSEQVAAAIREGGKDV